MPILIAGVLVVLRQLVIFIIQSVVVMAAIQLLTPLIDKLKEGVKTTFNLGDDDALTWISNFLLDTVELAGLSFAVFRSRMPLQIADKLGLVKRNFTRGALPAKVSTGPNSPGAVAAAAAKAPKPTVETVTKVTAEGKGITYAKVNEVLSFVAKLVGLPVGTLFVMAQFIDYGNWNSGAYQKTFQGVLGAFGLHPDAQIPKASTISDDVWKRVYNTYSESGAYAISDPYKEQSVVFSRQALIDLVDKIGAQLNLETGGASAKAVLAATTALVRLRSGETTTAAAVSSAVKTSTAAAVAVPSVSQVRVFTGIVSQGTLGDGLQFQARPDDLITSTADLQQAAENNIASFLTAIPSRFVYEIKVVASIVGKDGFTLRGGAQQVVSGYNKDGTAKYKTVVNKFAVANIFIINDKGARSKITTIVLGPTDAVNFQPGQDAVSSIEDALHSAISSTSLGDVSHIVVPPGTTTDTAASAQDPQKPDKTPIPKAPVPDLYPVGTVLRGTTPANSAGDIFYTFRFQGNDTWVWGDTFHGEGAYGNLTTAQVLAKGVSTGSAPAPAPSAPVSSYSGVSIVDYLRSAGMASDYDSRAALAAQHGITGYSGAPDQNTQLLAILRSGSTPAPSAPSTPVPTTHAGASANSLSEWYSANGQALPSLASRAQTYQSAGLGSASLYAGTAEQNTRLLQYLKGT